MPEKSSLPCRPASSRAPSWRIALLAALLALPLAAGTEDPPPESSDGTCAFDPGWISSPSFLDEVPATGVACDEHGENCEPDSTFCDFYQFSWQNFLYLISPSSGNPSKSADTYSANFLDSKLFLPYSSQEVPCKKASAEQTFFGTMPTGLRPRDWRSLDDSSKPDIHQAKSRAVIYDVDGKAAIYSTRFSPNLCDVGNIVPHPYFPAGTTELKMAWRILDKKEEKEQKRYFTVEAPAGSLGDEKTHTLGLIGFHIAIVTDAHPEMIWITIEHNQNDPLCDRRERDLPKPIAAHSWSFTKSECLDPERSEPCDFNDPGFDPDAGIDGEPTPICQVYEYGQLPDEFNAITKNDNDANRAAIRDLYKGFIEKSGEAEWAEVWTHYRMVGALWLSQPYSKDPRMDPGRYNSTGSYRHGNPGEGTFQRGSLALANSVAETDFQGPVEKEVQEGNGYVSALRNCFGCHGFQTNEVDMLLPVAWVSQDEVFENTIGNGTGTISHIFGKIFRDRCQSETYFSRPEQVKPFRKDDLNTLVNGCREVCTASQSEDEKLVWTGRFKDDGTRALGIKGVTDCQCCRLQD